MLTESAALRDAELQQVKDNSRDWFPAALAALNTAVLPAVFSGEDIRVILAVNGLPAPHHHNAWGALIMQAVRKGIIERTGQWVQMRAPTSHARMTAQYRRVPARCHG